VTLKQFHLRFVNRSINLVNLVIANVYINLITKMKITPIHFGMVFIFF